MKRYGCNGTVWRVVPNSETTKTREKFRLFKSRLKKFAFRIKSCLKNINEIGIIPFSFFGHFDIIVL